VREKRLVRLGYETPCSPRLRSLWPRSCLASFRRPNPLQPERISRRGTAGSYQAWRDMGAFRSRTRLQRGTFNTDPTQSGCAGKGEIFAPTPGRQSGAGRCAINRLSRICSKFRGNLNCQARSSSKRTGMFYKGRSQEKTHVLRLELFLLRSPLDRACSVLTCRAMCSVAGPCDRVVWVFSTSGFHRFLATKPVSSETNKAERGQIWRP